MSSAAQMTGVTDDCSVHYYIQQQNSFLSTSGGLMTHSGGGVCDKTPVSINYRGRGLGLWHHTDKNLRTAWFEKGLWFIEDLEKHWVDLYHYRMDVYTHCQHTLMFKQHVQVKFASNDPFNLHPIIIIYNFRNHFWVLSALLFSFDPPPPPPQPWQTQ